MSANPDLQTRVAQLDSADPRIRDLAAAEIGDLLEADVVSEAEFQSLAPLLIARAVAEKDPDVKEGLFHAISSSAVEKLSGPINLDPIAASLEELDVGCLEHALYILGFSGNSKYRKRLKQFVSHADEDIRRDAADALMLLAKGPRKAKSAPGRARHSVPRKKAL